MAGSDKETVVDEKVVEQTPEKTPAEKPAGEEPSFMDDLNKVLDQKIESESKTPDEKFAEAAKQGSPADGKAKDGGKAEGAEAEPAEKDEPGDGEVPPVDDALLERAVVAGMTLADAKAFPSVEALERVVARLESVKPAAGEEKKPEEKKPEEEDPLEGIPDLNPEDVQEDIAKGFNALKGIVREQFKTIAGLRTELSKSVEARQGTWLDLEIAKLGKDFVDVFGEGNTVELPAGKQKAARDKLQRAVAFAESEAKAEGRPIPRTEALKQALAISFGDKVKTVKDSAVQEAAAQRSRRALNRPRDTTGRFAIDPDAQFGRQEDRAADAVKELIEKFSVEA